MSVDENKELIRRYLEAIDANDSADWSLVDEFIADGIAIHRIRDGKIVEHWAVVDVARILQQVGALPGPPA